MGVQGFCVDGLCGGVFVCQVFRTHQHPQTASFRDSPIVQRATSDQARRRRCSPWLVAWMPANASATRRPVFTTRSPLRRATPIPCQRIDTQQKNSETQTAARPSVTTRELQTWGRSRCTGISTKTQGGGASLRGSRSCWFDDCGCRLDVSRWRTMQVLGAVHDP